TCAQHPQVPAAHRPSHITQGSKLRKAVHWREELACSERQAHAAWLEPESHSPASKKNNVDEEKQNYFIHPRKSCDLSISVFKVHIQSLLMMGMLNETIDSSCNFFFFYAVCPSEPRESQLKDCSLQDGSSDKKST
ncbi:hypothetical protein LEMLEM_LOCUS1634, partial [Lemmus lemmus]